MRKLSDEKIIEKILENYPNSKILKIERVGERRRIVVDFICGVCGSYNKSQYDNIKTNSGCRTCGINKYKYKIRKYTIGELDKILKGLGFEWLNKNDYIDDSSNIITRCEKCGKISKSTITARVNHGRGCRKCKGLEKKNIEIFKQEVYELEGNNYIVLSSLYTDTHDTNILIRHNICGHEYYVSRNNFKKGRRCPKCSISRGEKAIIQYLDNKNIEYIYDSELFNDLCGVGGRVLRYDFYLPEYNLLIEFQGRQHEKEEKGFGDFERQQEHDRRKREYAKRNNIDLLEIWYYDFDKIEEILKERLFSE